MCRPQLLFQTSLYGRVQAQLLGERRISGPAQLSAPLPSQRLTAGLAGELFGGSPGLTLRLIFILPLQTKSALFAYMFLVGWFFYCFLLRFFKCRHCNLC